MVLRTRKSAVWRWDSWKEPLMVPKRRRPRCTNCSGGLRRRFPPRGSPRRSMGCGVWGRIGWF